MQSIFRVFVIAILFSGCKKTVEVTWPEITQETKPWTRWWWHGSAVTEKDISAALEAYQKAGLGGVEITPIYGVRGAENQFIEFLSPKWMEKLVYTLNEAKRLGLGVDLANASGWPFGGPWIDEEAACKYMTSLVFRVQGGNRLTETLKYVQQPLVQVAGSKKFSVNEIKRPVTANENLQEYAFEQIHYERELDLIVVTAHKMRTGGFTTSIDLTDKVVNGKLEWTAPEGGEWIVCALFQGDHGKMVERAGPGGEGNVIDHFSGEAISNYLNRFDEAFKGYDLNYLRYYFNDSYEVDDAQGESNWTPDMFQEFEKIHGYDLREHLPALLGYDTENKNNRVLYDYRVVLNNLLLNNYTRKWQQWAAGQGKGIRNQAHGSPANILDLYAVSDVPEIEGRNVVRLKSAPSAAHVTGKKLASSESATWLNEHFQTTLGDVKAAIDNFLLAGVNHVFYHGTAYSPQNAQWPGWLFYAAVHFTPANSFWNDFGALNRYIARAQSFLQSGKPANDILLYYAISDSWSDHGRSMLRHFHDIFEEGSLKKCADYLTENGYSWDAISDRQLLDVTYTKSALHTGGNSYKCIFIPETQYIPVETFDKLLNLALQGATLLFDEKLPDDVPGWGSLDENGAKLNALKNRLSFVENDGQYVCKYGKGQIIISKDLPSLMKHSGITPESMYDSGFQCIRRKKENGNYYYFVKNNTQTAFEGWLPLNVDFCSAVLYNPMTGNDGYAKTRKHNNKSELYIQFKPGEAFIIETFSGKYTGESYPFYKKSGEPVALPDDWDIEFVQGGPILPQSIKTNKLQSWTEYGPEYSVFSGTAAYTIKLPTKITGHDAWLLDMGTVHESASVHINGKYMGTVIGSPYSIEIPSGILTGNDELKIMVSNLMANRIIDLDKKEVVWRNFYNTNFPARRRENTGTDGKFTAKNWEPFRSGIIGTLTLTPLSIY